MKPAETVNDALLEAFKAVATDDIGCIVYVFDRSEGGGGTGFNSQNCDAGDAMVMMTRLAEIFDLDVRVCPKLPEIELFQPSETTV